MWDLALLLEIVVLYQVSVVEERAMQARFGVYRFLEK